jgi:hypothetical protein
MMKIKILVVGAALTASAFIPAIGEARATWT